MTDTTDLADLKKRAEAAGLTRLTEEHLKQLQRATQGMQRHKENLRVELEVSDEPAHVFSLVEKG
ncbi:MAG: hypothetical protein AAF942_04040 [Pseudomonadota bacterium]